MTRSLIAFFTACFASLLAGKAWAQYPQGVKSGASPEASQDLVTLAIPAVVGVNVAHNFVLDFASGTTCWGTTGYGSFPPSGGLPFTTYTFAVSSASIPSSNNVACPGAGAQPDVATVQVLSTVAGSTGHLQASIVDGGQGAQTTKFSDLVADIFSAHRLTLSSPNSPCGGTPHFPYNLGTVAGDEVTAIPTVGWTACGQTLSLTFAAATPYSGGTATGTITFTMASP